MKIAVNPAPAGDRASLSLDGRVIAVTGGGNGIGEATAVAIASNGGRVLIADIDVSAGERVAASIRESGHAAFACTTDVADEGSARSMAAAALDHFGRIDGLVNNAALMASLPRRPWHEIPLAEWDQVMAVNLRGPFLCCRAVWPAMRAAGGGAIVNLSSNRVFDGTPNRLHYTTSKGGVIAFTRALARELGPHNIRVNAVAPGITLSEKQLASSSSEYLADMARGRALTRPQTPSDLVGAILFLLSPASGFITGQTLVVDGGKMMR